MVRPAGPDSDLASRIAAAFARDQRVGFVRHGAAVVAVAPEESHLRLGEGSLVAGLALNGRESLLAVSGHLDLPIRRVLLSDVDLAIVEGIMESRSPTVLELGPDGSGLREALESGAKNFLALVGPCRPIDRLPPGGIPWFPRHELPSLLEHLRDHLDAALRARPLWALLLGGTSSDPTDVQAAFRILASRCERVFADPATPSEASGAEALASHHPRLGEVGQILTALESFPGAAFLAARADGDPGLDERIRELFHRRNPYRTATAYREPETHLPIPFPAVWEPKARARIHLALAGDIHCPQRILTHSQVELLDPFGC